MPSISEDKMRDRLRGAVAAAGGYSALAREWGVSQQYLWCCCAGSKPISSSVAERLGYRPLRIVRYVEVES